MSFDIVRTKAADAVELGSVQAGGVLASRAPQCVISLCHWSQCLEGPRVTLMLTVVL